MPARTIRPTRAPRKVNGRAVDADKSLLKQRAYTDLREWIQQGRFAPGAFLSERQLAAELGMSKTPVKAALERLELEGFIAVSPQQGIVVRDLMVHEIADQFEIRLALESFVLRSIAGKLDSQETSRLRENLEAQHRAAQRKDVFNSVELDAAFHALFCQFLGNQEILRVMADLRGKMHRVISRVLGQEPARMATSLEEHRRIAEAVLRGDADAAVLAIKEHLEYGKQYLLSPRRR